MKAPTSMESAKRLAGHLVEDGVPSGRARAAVAAGCGADGWNGLAQAFRKGGAASDWDGTAARGVLVASAMDGDRVDAMLERLSMSSASRAATKPIAVDPAEDSRPRAAMAALMGYDEPEPAQHVRKHHDPLLAGHSGIGSRIAIAAVRDGEGRLVGAEVHEQIASKAHDATWFTAMTRYDLHGNVLEDGALLPGEDPDRHRGMRFVPARGDDELEIGRRGLRIALDAIGATGDMEQAIVGSASCDARGVTSPGDPEKAFRVRCEHDTVMRQLHRALWGREPHPEDALPKVEGPRNQHGMNAEQQTRTALGILNSASPTAALMAMLGRI